MSIGIDDAELAGRLREVLKSRGVSMRALSDALNIPYRSVQNYLSGTMKIPATFFLRVCHHVDVEADYFIYNDFQLHDVDLFFSVVRALEKSGLLPELPPDSDAMSVANRLGRAHRAAAIVGEAYDLQRSMKLKTLLDGSAPPFGQRQRSADE